MNNKNNNGFLRNAFLYIIVIIAVVTGVQYFAGGSQSPSQQLSYTQLLKKIEKSGRDLTQRFGLEAIVITGVEVSGSDGRARMGNLVLEKEKADWCFSVKEGGSYSGTGDLLASVLSAGMVRGIPMKACVEKAVEFLGGAIHDAVEEGTDRNDGVCFEKYLGILTQI